MGARDGWAASSLCLSIAVMIVLPTILQISTTGPSHALAAPDRTSAPVQEERTGPEPSVMRSSGPICLKDIQGVLVIDCDGGSPDIYLRNLEAVTIRNLVSEKRSLIDIEDCTMIEFDNVEIDGHELGISGESIVIRNSLIRDCSLTMSAWSRSEYSNTTYINTTLKIEFEDDVPVHHNTFLNSTLDLSYTTNMNVTFNTFIGVRAKLLAEPLDTSYSQHNRIFSNIFEGCTHGFELGGMAMTLHFYYFEIRDNYFGNCTAAIYLPFCNACESRVWGNIFYHNGGTGDSGTGSQIYMSVSYSFNSDTWYFNGMGNCWWHHRTPDRDNDGIVDMPLDLQNQQPTPIHDNYPLTDVYWKLFKPRIDIISPIPASNLSQDQNISWTIESPKFNITTAELSIDRGEWISVTDLSHMFHAFERGTHTVHIRACNTLGLWNSSSVTFTVTYGPNALVILEPEDGDLMAADPVSLRWRYSDMDELLSVRITTNDEELDPGVGVNAYSLDLEEGHHIVSVKAWDIGYLNASDSVEFDIDRTPPFVEVLSPKDGDLISNQLVELRWNVTDNHKLWNASFRMDHGQWREQETFPGIDLKEFLDSGGHQLQIRSWDMAGFLTEVNVDFEITDHGGDCIIEPPGDVVTAVPYVDFEWKEPDWLDIARTEMYMEETGTRIDLTGSLSHELHVEKKGINTIFLRFCDVYGNHYMESRTVILDQDPPFVDFLDKSVHVNRSSFEVLWRGRDEFGISGYCLQMDGGDWSDISIDTNAALTDLSEGKHSLTVKAIDLAGNSARATWEFTVDTIPPSVDLLVPEEGSVIPGPLWDIVWIAVDENDHLDIVLKVDEREYSYSGSGGRQVVLTSGKHTIRLLVMDIANNSIDLGSTFYVDNEEPILQWMMETQEYSRERDIELRWEAMDDTWIAGQFREIDGYGLFPVTGNSSRIYLEEGAHSINITVTDAASRVSSIIWEVFVDASPPELQSLAWTRTEKGVELMGNFFDNQSGISSVVLILDGNLVGSMENGFTYLADLDIWKENAFQAEVSDMAGWTSTFSVTVPPVEPGEEDSKGGSWMAIILIMIAILLMAGVAISMFFQVRRKNKLPEEEEKDRGDVLKTRSPTMDAIQLRAPPPSKFVPPPPSTERLPPATVTIENEGPSEK